MREPLEALNLPAHLSGYHKIRGQTADPLGTFKPMQESSKDDPENAWKSYHLFSEYLTYMIKSGNHPKEMKIDLAKLRFLNYFNYLSFPFGVLIAAAIINPIFLGRTSRVLRKIVCGFSGYYLYNSYYAFYGNYKKMFLLKNIDYFPPHVRRYLETKDHRYLYAFEYNANPYKLYDGETKKSIY